MALLNLTQGQEVLLVPETGVAHDGTSEGATPAPASEHEEDNSLGYTARRPPAQGDLLDLTQPHRKKKGKSILTEKKPSWVLSLCVATRQLWVLLDMWKKSQHNRTVIINVML
ncbi:hypothetical protein FQA47_004529 [Oryzias melastigma]|uniref:Uncharacterized protein n=1 Tax=Oryzias melastigma TaxID=30732 RepID=A0A834CDQ8_ORYME|nr:hypothetical protein FQA47_004529 [Oryzias melastigma]